MRTFAISGLILICAAIGAAVWFLNKPVMHIQVVAPSHAHVYHDAAKPLEHIGLNVFYAIPKDKNSSAYQGWQDIIDGALSRTRRFHALQFRGRSDMEYRIYPQPIFLEHPSDFYDTTSTNYGNPHALIAVAEEIDRRVFSEKGDLYNADFVSGKNSAYSVMGIIYEGVGASGGIIYESSSDSIADIAAKLGVPESIIYKVDVQSADGFFILNRSYLTDAGQKVAGPTLIYHEFGHTLGVPDEYDPSSTQVFSDDIMGGGRENPIESTYIDEKHLEAMGIVF